VGVEHRRRTRGGTRPWVGALAAAVVLLIMLAVPMSAASSKTKLSNATVSPRTGGTTTKIAVSVVYQNANGSRADSVNVSFDSATHEMVRDATGSWGKGVTFRWSGTVAQGRHDVVIHARAKDNSDATLSAGTVTIALPPPTPTPTPKPHPTPTPTPTPTHRPESTPRPTPTSGATTTTVNPTPTPTPSSTAAPGSVGVPVPTPTTPPVNPAPTYGPPEGLAIVGLGIGGANGAGGGPTDQGGPTAPGSPTNPGGGTDGSVAPTGGGGAGGSGGGSGSGHHDPWNPVSTALAAIGLQPTFGFPPLGLAPTLVTTTSAVGAAMALSLFSKRRREEDPPDDLMSAASASGVAVSAYDLAANNAAVAAAANADVMDVEMLLPRWRRPSLLQARKADPIRDTTPAPRLTFDEGLTGPLGGRERRVVRYRVVRLLDTPDELRGQEIGYLDQGDEVQLLDKYGAYFLVVAPDGQQGWLHKMTLGEVVEAEGASRDGPRASMGMAADSWTMGESDVDSDVLEAYLESRRRSA
jgi:hypothetical protein